MLEHQKVEASYPGSDFSFIFIALTTSFQGFSKQTMIIANLHFKHNKNNPCHVFFTHNFRLKQQKYSLKLSD